jgi:hypothetical protein
VLETLACSDGISISILGCTLPTVSAPIPAAVSFFTAGSSGLVNLAPVVGVTYAHFQFEFDPLIFPN